MEYLEELRHLLTIAQHPKTINYLQRAIDIETAKSQNGTETTVEAPKQRPTRTPTRVKISNYGWDQSDKFVKIYISDLTGLDSVKSENLKGSFTEKSMSVEILNLNGKNYSLVINDLMKPISPDQSSVKVKSGMVIVSLRKTASSSWEFLTGREKKIKDSKDVKPDLPDTSGDPGAGLMQMMQKMYEDGDDDMKKTIRKAWHESQEKKMKGEEGL